MNESTHDELTCRVCGKREDDPALISYCADCARPFHLNPFNNREGIDCGDVWSGGEENPALQFFCHPCMAAAHEEAQRTVDGVSPPPPAPSPAAAASPNDNGPPPVVPRRRYRRIDQ